MTQLSAARINAAVARSWKAVSPRLLPFADVATRGLPLGRLLRLGLFQVSVGMALVLLNGTLNRVMIVELAVPAWLVSLMVSLPIVFAPLRALIGHRSDEHRSFLGWRRVPYIWMGTLLQFGGFAIMPFALLVLSGLGQGPEVYGHVGAALAFLLVGAGLHTTQTAGLALATDLAPEDKRPRVVALLYVMLLLGMVASALVFGWLLDVFSQLRLIQVVQGAAVVTMVLNGIALWKQEARDPERTRHDRERPAFRDAWGEFSRDGRSRRLLVAVALGTAGFNMQDILLEPYGAEVLGLPVAATTVLTALLAGGTLVGFAWAARRLGRGADPHRLAGLGALIGVAAFGAVLFAGPLGTAGLFRCGTVLIGLGGGLFAVSTLIAAMDLGGEGRSGLALGAFGAAQATAAGVGIFVGGALRDAIAGLASAGVLGPALTGPATAYGFVYQVEILLLFAAMVAIGPLVRSGAPGADGDAGEGQGRMRFGLTEFPS